MNVIYCINIFNNLHIYNAFILGGELKDVTLCPRYRKYSFFLKHLQTKSECVKEWNTSSGFVSEMCAIHHSRWIIAWSLINVDGHSENNKSQSDLQCYRPSGPNIWGNVY